MTSKPVTLRPASRRGYLPHRARPSESLSGWIRTTGGQLPHSGPSRAVQVADPLSACRRFEPVSPLLYGLHPRHPQARTALDSNSDENPPRTQTRISASSLAPLRSWMTRTTAPLLGLSSLQVELLGGPDPTGATLRPRPTGNPTESSQSDRPGRGPEPRYPVGTSTSTRRTR